MATKTKSSNEKNGVGKSPCVGSVLNRALTSNSQWPDKDEFLDVIYWGRQVLGIVLGLVWGFIPLKGFIGLFLFCVINAALIYFYASSFQGVDEEEFGGMWELTKEGFVTSFAGFLVMWIILYSGLHYD
ncbi:GEL complex subunit OPTI [Procambarus clarkii]|uniref:GEL complex subunit OPTI n=1 Tax=Procambarus clarkii TaxID=6728 RepID=UPI001E673D5A|nr:respirasome Complex Assembly Factor 1-like [Procambarus clarkii]